MSRKIISFGISLLSAITLAFVCGQYSFAQSDAEVLDTHIQAIITSTTTDGFEDTTTDGRVASSIIEALDASTTFPGAVLGEAEEEVTDEMVYEVSDFDQSLNLNEIDKIIQAIADSQTAYFEKNGKYLQILQNQKLPEYESGTVKEKLGAVPNNITVNVYEGPKGKGFQVVYRDKGTIKAVGYGPEAEALSYTNEIEVVDMRVATTTASSTVDVLDATTTEEATTSTDSTTDKAPTGDNAGTTTPAIDKKAEDSISAAVDDGADDAAGSGADPAAETATTTAATE